MEKINKRDEAEFVFEMGIVYDEFQYRECKGYTVDEEGEKG